MPPSSSLPGSAAHRGYRTHPTPRPTRPTSNVHTQTRRRVVSPAYMDRLLMNYLVVEGHKEAAAALAEEAGVARE